MKIDPAELRRRNMIRPEQMPYKNAMGQTYDSGAFEKILDQGLALADWNGFAARREDSKPRGKLRGRGIATFLEWTGGNCVRGEGQRRRHARRLHRDLLGDAGDGPGHRDQLRAARGRRVRRADREDPHRPGRHRRAATASAAPARARSSPAARRCSVASERTVEHAKALAGEALEAAAADIEYRAGRFSVVGTDVGIDLFALAGKQPGQRIHLDATTTVGGATWPNACHVCEVEVDPDTRRRSRRRLRVGQRHRPRRQPDDRARPGRRRRGAGHRPGARRAGRLRRRQPASSSPAASWTTRCRAPTWAPRSAPSSTPRSRAALNPLGVKGVGELGTIGATPAVINAVIDALAHAGLGRAAEKIQMPATPERVWQMLRAAPDRPLGPVSPDRARTTGTRRAGAASAAGAG